MPEALSLVPMDILEGIGSLFPRRDRDLPLLETKKNLTCNLTRHLTGRVIIVRANVAERGRF